MTLPKRWLEQLEDFRSLTNNLFCKKKVLQRKTYTFQCGKGTIAFNMENIKRFENNSQRLQTTRNEIRPKPTRQNHFACVPELIGAWNQTELHQLVIRIASLANRHTHMKFVLRIILGNNGLTGFARASFEIQLNQRPGRVRETILYFWVVGAPLSFSVKSETHVSCPLL